MSAALCAHHIAEACMHAMLYVGDATEMVSLNFDL